MKESLRRPVLFAVIVITGSILILFDIPLTIMIPVVLIVGIAILFIVGAVTVAEIKNAGGNFKKIGIIKKLDGMKFFEKSTPAKKDTTKPAKEVAKQPVKGVEKKGGIGLHVRSFVSSLKSLGTVLKARRKPAKKIEEIDKQLDRAVSEKVEKRPAPGGSAQATGTSMPSPAGGAGIAGADATDGQDPFLSLSEDEFDLGLLDSLDDLDSPASPAGITEDTSAPLPDTAIPEMNEPDIPLPTTDTDEAAEDILKDNAQGLEEFSGLEGADAMDSDFGDLDNLSLDDIDIDEDTEEVTPQLPETPAEPAPKVVVAPPETGKEEVKTEWVKSDAPKDLVQPDDQLSTQAEMASFAGGGGSDADLLSSLASDVKHVKVEKNLSLLRELKDYKAPADEIESELTDMYTRMDTVKKTQKKDTPPSEGIK
jgi:hypothetical protein